MKRRSGAEDGAMGIAIALLLLVIILSLVMYSLFIIPGYTSGKTARAGMTRITDSVITDGGLTGYADHAGMFGTVRVENPRPSPAELGAVQIPLRLASVRLSWETGSGADLGNATVVLTGPSGTETLPRSGSSVLKKPAWAIVQKGSTLPGQTANRNDLLEPNERFVLFVLPPHPIPPGTPFTIRIAIPDEDPVTLVRIVPDPVTPVMDLG